MSDSPDYTLFLGEMRGVMGEINKRLDRHSEALKDINEKVTRIDVDLSSVKAVGVRAGAGGGVLGGGAIAGLFEIVKWLWSLTKP